jgi:hypothetical protein
MDRPGRKDPSQTQCYLIHTFCILLNFCFDRHDFRERWYFNHKPLQLICTADEKRVVKQVNLHPQYKKKILHKHRLSDAKIPTYASRRSKTMPSHPRCDFGTITSTVHSASTQLIYRTKCVTCFS